VLLPIPPLPYIAICRIYHLALYRRLLER
jgi:hypothetical protein